MGSFDHSSPEDLLRHAREAGDLGPLLDHYRGYLKVIARLQIGLRLEGKADASDVVQETLLKVHRSFRTFRGSTEQEWLAWLRRVLATTLANLVRHYVGTQARNIQLEQQLQQDIDDTSMSLASLLVSRQASPSEAVMKQEQAVILASMLERLSDDHRQVVTLRHLKHLGFAEIAVRMNRSVEAVKKLWARALVQLRQMQADQP